MQASGQAARGVALRAGQGPAARPAHFNCLRSTLPQLAIPSTASSATHGGTIFIMFPFNLDVRAPRGTRHILVEVAADFVQSHEMCQLFLSVTQTYPSAYPAGGALVAPPKLCELSSQTRAPPAIVLYVRLPLSGL